MKPILGHRYPKRIEFWENRPLDRSPVRRRFSGLILNIDTLGGAVKVTPILDGVALTPIAGTNTSKPVTVALVPSAAVGRDLWAKIEDDKVTPIGFRVYDVQPVVIETFPPQVNGRLPNISLGDEGEIIGIELKVCTLGELVTFTPIFDNAADTGRNFTIQTGADEPEEHLIRFTAPKDAKAFTLSVNKPVEIYTE